MGIFEKFGFGGKSEADPMIEAARKRAAERTTDLQAKAFEAERARNLGSVESDPFAGSSEGADEARVARRIADSEKAETIRKEIEGLS